MIAQAVVVPVDQKVSALIMQILHKGDDFRRAFAAIEPREQRHLTPIMQLKANLGRHHLAAVHDAAQNLVFIPFDVHFQVQGSLRCIDQGHDGLP